MTSRYGPWALFAASCALAAVLSLPDLDRPGLYYDEVIQATPASEFLREGGKPLAIPGARSTRLFGGWFPLMTQPYMGALKSQLLIPVFAVFEPGPASLRATTLAWSALGLGLFMLWARSLFGTSLALVAGALLVVDPSFLFVGRHDWGSSALGLVCRCGGLWLATTGWKQRSSPRLLAAGLLFGLGIYNKIDFAPFLAGAALALGVAAPRLARSVLRERPTAVAAFAGGIVVAAAPVLAGLTGVLSATGSAFRNQGPTAAAWGEKLVAWTATLDGSYFHRLMLSGGSFEELGTVQAAVGGPLLVLCIASAAWLAWALGQSARSGERDAARAFVLWATLFTTLLLLLTPKAVRIHHVLNVHPLPHLLVALAAADLWSRRAILQRAIAVVAIAAALLGSLRIDRAVRDYVAETGGSGRWSGSLEAFARELPADSRVVSLDWGFDARLRFVRPELDLEEPVWRMVRQHPSAPPFVLAGGPRHVYLIQAPRWQVFDVGRRLLAAARRLPPEAVEILAIPDEAGETAFLALRFAGEHQLAYRGDFEVRLK